MTTKAKKGFLATGIGVLTTGVTVAVNGQYIEGAILVLIGVGLVLAYDYLDDRVKGTPSLPDGVNEAFFEEVAETTAETAAGTDIPAALQQDNSD